MLRAIPDSESTPPLYYVLAWLWTHVFGTGEVGLRSLSALLGTATIVVVWALGRRLGGDRAGAGGGGARRPSTRCSCGSARRRAPTRCWCCSARCRRCCGCARWTRISASGRRQQPAPVQVRPCGRRPSDDVTRACWHGARRPRSRSRRTTTRSSSSRRRRSGCCCARPAGASAPLVLALPAIAAVALAPLALGQRENDTAAIHHRQRAADPARAAAQAVSRRLRRTAGAVAGRRHRGRGAGRCSPGSPRC